MQKLKIDSTFYMDDVVIFGLVSQLPAYRLSFFINDALSIQLNRAKRDKEFNYKSNSLFYSTFEFEDEKKGLQWFLTANKNPLIYDQEESEDRVDNARIVSGLPLVSSLKVIDYFFGYYGEENRLINQNINLQLKELPYVSTFHKIDLDKTKHIEHLLIH